jgi:signal peptidase II
MALHESRPLVEGFLSLTHVRNRGAAFGLLSDADLPFQAALFSIVSVAALVAIAIYAFRLPPKSTLPRAGLALILAGAMGNLIDRALLGYVIDFVDVYWRSHHWPAFNLADSAISVGVALLLLDSLVSPQQTKAGLRDASSAGRSE